MLDKYFQKDFGASVDLAPPTPREEAVPGSRVGCVWVRGFWDWRDGRHVWSEGHWKPARRDFHWEPTRWVQREGIWYLQYGGWVKEAYVEERKRRRDDLSRSGSHKALKLEEPLRD